MWDTDAGGIAAAAFVVVRRLARAGNLAADERVVVVGAVAERLWPVVFFAIFASQQLCQTNCKSGNRAARA